MREKMKVCSQCGRWSTDRNICKGCGSIMVQTQYLLEMWVELSSNTGPGKIQRFFVWKHGHGEFKQHVLEKYSQEELEYIFICPRCGSLASMEENNNCRYCGAQMIPTRYKYEEILQRDMTKEDFAQWKKILYGEYCYPSPLFDKEEFHRTRILKGEEEDPAKKQEEQMEQILDAIRWAGSRNL